MLSIVLKTSSRDAELSNLRLEFQLGGRHREIKVMPSFSGLGFVKVRWLHLMQVFHDRNAVPATPAVVTPAVTIPVQAPEPTPELGERYRLGSFCSSNY